MMQTSSNSQSNSAVGTRSHRTRFCFEKRDGMGKNARSRDVFFISWTDFNLSGVFLERHVNARYVAKDENFIYIKIMEK